MPRTTLLALALPLALAGACDRGPGAATQASAACPPAAAAQLDLNHPLSFGQKDGKTAVTGCSERIVELPFVHRHLPHPFRGKLLDVGYLESELIYQVASLGFDTWGIDIRPPASEFPGVHHLTGDVITYPFEPGSFDVVVILSTLEHIGLSAYGNIAADPQGDLHALEASRRIVKDDGRLLLTVPFGKPGVAGWYRVYDHAGLVSMLERAGLVVEIEDYWVKQGDVSWVPAGWQAAEQVDSLSRGSQAVACIVARPAGLAAPGAPATQPAP